MEKSCKFINQQLMMMFGELEVMVQKKQNLVNVGK
jgi:hypothetical protein